MPSIATSTGSGAVVPAARRRRPARSAPSWGRRRAAPPSRAASWRPRARPPRRPRWWPPRTTHARGPRRALAVGDHHHRELAQQRVERLAEAQLVLALGRDLARRRRRSRSASRCRSWRAARRRWRGRTSASRTRRAAGRRSRATSAASVSTKQSIVAKRGEIIPAPLHCALRRTVPDGSSHLEVGALLEGVGRLDRLLEVGVAARREPAARLEDALAAPPRRRQVLADAAGRGERDLGRVDARRRAPPRPASWRRLRARAGRSRRSRSRSSTSTARSASSRQRSRLSSTGAAAAPEEVKRAALTGCSASQTSSPTSGRPLGFSPAADAGRAEAAPAGPSRGRARGRARARAPSASGRTAARRRLHRDALSVPSRQAEHHVQVLDRLRGGALPEVVDRGEARAPCRVCASAVGEDAAEVGRAHLARPGRRRRRPRRTARSS